MIDLLQHLDLTNLEHDLMDHELKAFLQKSYSEQYHVAAVCLAQENIRIAKEYLKNSPVKIASVFNFPLGLQSLVEIEDAISWAINEGIDECDVVLSLEHLEAGHDLREMKADLIDFVKEVRSYCPNKVLKIIIATDLLKDTDKIKIASEAVIAGKADFIKTCTGKTGGATPEAVDAILEVIQATSSPIGIKVSGGVKTVDAATGYYEQVRKALKADALTSKQFRIGASQLIDEILR